MAIFTPEELSAYLQRDIPTDQAWLARELAEGVLAQAAPSLSVLTVIPAAIKLVALAVASRLIVNPAGMTTQGVGPFSNGFGTTSAFLTDEERAIVSQTLGLGGGKARSVSLTGMLD